MLDSETKRKIRELKIPGTTDAVEVLNSDTSFEFLTFDERPRTIIDYSY